jgi:adenylate cyclase class 2
MNGQETEVKFYVGDLAKIETRLVELDALLIQPRAHELNMRFDTPDRSLRKEGKVLRLRQDESAKMTFKSGTTALNGILTRKEIEFGVESFTAARQLIESLGYEVILFYEKYRRTYELKGLHIMLDQLPYGDFVEIEGENVEAIQEMADEIGCHWDAAITTSYSALFERVAKPRRLNPAELTFAAFSAGKPDAGELSVQQADGDGT